MINPEKEVIIDENMSTRIENAKIHLGIIYSKLEKFKEKKDAFEELLNAPASAIFMDRDEAKKFFQDVEYILEFVNPILEDTRAIIEQLKPTPRRELKPLETLERI